ncbi:MAG: FtsX-like permease family protein [Candidatus Hodarchaeota archaeon]
MSSCNARAEIRKKSIGFVFQFFQLFEHLSAAENVEYLLLIARKKRQYRKQRVKFFVLCVFPLAIGVSIMLTTYRTVNERIREIGTFEGLGMKPWEIMAIFLLEATFIGIIETIIRSTLGILITFPLTNRA